jgi:hypothetical protein
MKNHSRAMSEVSLKELAAQLKAAARELSPTDRSRAGDALWAALSTPGGRTRQVISKFVNW